MTSGICARCGSDDLRRSKTRNVIEQLLKIFSYKAYRCDTCGWRGYRRRPGDHQRYGPVDIPLDHTNPK